jgi:hypothetical protein
MKGITKAQLQDRIESHAGEKQFNLYRFVMEYGS